MKTSLLLVTGALGAAVARIETCAALLERTRTHVSLKCLTTCSGLCGLDVCEEETTCVSLKKRQSKSSRSPPKCTMARTIPTKSSGAGVILDHGTGHAAATVTTDATLGRGTGLAVVKVVGKIAATRAGGTDPVAATVVAATGEHLSRKDHRCCWWLPPVVCMSAAAEVKERLHFDSSSGDGACEIDQRSKRRQS